MKEKINRVTIKTLASQESENAIVKAVVTYMRQIDNFFVSEERMGDIQTALKEAIDNVISFAYEKKVGKVSVSFHCNKMLVIEVRDWGCGIKDIDQARTPMFTTDAENEHAGMGFTIMETFSNELIVKSTPGKGTIVTMKYKI